MYYWKFIIFQPTFMQKGIKFFLKYFLIAMAAYQIIVTVLWYGILWWDSQTKISIIRDAIRICFVILVAIWDSEWIKWYWKKWKKVRILLGILILFSIWVSYLQWISLNNMMIWIKYWFYFLIIFLTASFVWYVWIKKIWLKEFSRIQYLMMAIVWLGFIWQILKIYKSDIFMDMWYGKLDDFSYGTNPPIYYLTSYEGTMRRQWLFAWPNNYGYFLVAFLPIILLWWWWTWQEIKGLFKNPKQYLNILLSLLRIVAICMTLSRSAILGMAVVFAFLAKNRIKEHKELSIRIFAIFIAWIVWLSFLKPESTIWHFKSNFAYIWEIINHPLWHGLGSSGPAIHHEWTMLPENYFMQIMLDIWTLWFILRTIVIFSILLIFKAIQNCFKKWKYNWEDSAMFLQRRRLSLWRTALLIMWFFLHVFEDSMVNYLFFTLFWIISGYLSKLYDEKDEIKPINFLKNKE